MGLAYLEPVRSAGTLTLNHLSVDHATVLNVDPYTQDDVMMCALHYFCVHCTARPCELALVRCQ